MEYLGINKQSQPLSLSALMSFLVIFGVQLAFILKDMLPGFPTLEDLYGAVINAIVVTAIFYGFNKVVERRSG